MLGLFLYLRPMHTDIKHLTDFFRGVKHIREVVEQYCLAPDMSETSIDDLTFAFEQMYQVSVEYYLAPDLRDQLLRGMYLRNNATIKIYLDDTLSPQWRRYVAVKELCHLILHDADYMTVDPGSLIELLIYEETTPQDGEAPLDLVADMWAKRAAHEFLFPYDNRASARAKMERGEETLFSIAQKFGVPEHVIEWTLNETYAQLCDQVWTTLKIE